MTIRHEDIPYNLAGVSFKTEKNLPEVNVGCEDMAAAALLVIADCLAEIIPRCCAIL